MRVGTGWYKTQCSTAAVLAPVNKSGLQHSCLSVETHLPLYFSHVLLTHPALTPPCPTESQCTFLSMNAVQKTHFELRHCLSSFMKLFSKSFFRSKSKTKTPKFCVHLGQAALETACLMDPFYCV